MSFSFIDSPFSERTAYEAYLELPAAARPAALQKAQAAQPAPATASILKCAMLPDALEKRDGTRIGQEALAGKIVVLFFSSAWCPACKVFCPILKTLYEDSKEGENPLEVVYVSSDKDAAMKDSYMQLSHGDWLSVPYDNKVARDGLKMKYGCFAGAEASGFRGIKRRAGIPSIVIISPAGAELVHMDCDPPTAIMRKGDAILDEWGVHKWP